MTQEIYKNKMCKYCKNKCNENIVFEEMNKVTVIKCSNYEPIETVQKRNLYNIGKYGRWVIQWVSFMMKI